MVASAGSSIISFSSTDENTDWEVSHGSLYPIYASMIIYGGVLSPIANPVMKPNSTTNELQSISPNNIAFYRSRLSRDLASLTAYGIALIIHVASNVAITALKYFAYGEVSVSFCSSDVNGSP